MNTGHPMDHTLDGDESITIRCEGGTRDGELHPVPVRAIRSLRQPFEDEPTVVQFCRTLPGGYLHREHYEVPPINVFAGSHLPGVITPAANISSFVFSNLCTHPAARAFRVYGGPFANESSLLLPAEWDMMKKMFTQEAMKPYFEVVEFPGPELAVCYVGEHDEESVHGVAKLLHDQFGLSPSGGVTWSPNERTGEPTIVASDDD